MLAPPPPAAEYWSSPSHWGTLSVAGENTSFRQTVTFDYTRAEPGAPPRWLLHRVTQPNPSLRREDWADGATCPALASAMSALAAIPGPSFHDPSDDRTVRGERLVLDGRDFSLEADGGYPLAEPGTSTHARIRVQSNDGGPLDAWFARLDRATATCWTTEAPSGGPPRR